MKLTHIIIMITWTNYGQNCLLWSFFPVSMNIVCETATHATTGKLCLIDTPCMANCDGYLVD